MKKLAVLGLAVATLVSLVPIVLAQDAADGPWNTLIIVACPGSSPCTYSITAYNGDGSEAGTYTPTSALSAHGSTEIAISAVVGSGGAWNGSAIVSSDNEVAATAVMYVDNSIDREIYSSYTGGATEVYFATTLGHIWGQNHVIAIQNITSSPVTGNIYYYAAGETTPTATFPFSLNGYGSIAVDTSASAPDGPGLTGFSGSTKITASGDIVAAIHGPNYSGQDAVAFEHSLPGNTTLYFPTALGGPYSAQLATFFAIQNVGDSDTNLTATFADASGTYVTTTVLGPGAKWNLFPMYPDRVQTNPTLPEKFSGALTVESDSQPIAGVSNQKAMNAAGAYGCASTQHQMMEYTAQGPAASAQNQVVPFVRYSTDTNGWTTYIAVQNVDTSPIDVSAYFYNEDGSLLTPAGGGTNPLVFTNVSVGGKASPIWVNAVNDTLSEWSGSVIIEGTGLMQVAVTNKQVNNCNAASVLGQAFTP